MTPDELDRRIERLLYEELALQDGEMPLPLKEIEIRSLGNAIRELIGDAVREATQ